jgi:tryptophan synthase alpha chain
MSKIKNAFKNGKAFIGYLTGGDPSIEKCEEFVLEMVKAGADLIEIGIPFSDPVAEGPINQNSNIRALSAGTTTDKIFEMVHSIRKKTDVPLVLLTYLNPVFAYGYEKFFSRCKELGIDGIIVPDLPFEEKGEVAKIAKICDVDVISLIAPTSNERIKMIAEDAQGFVYIVSSMGVTGIRDKINTDIKSIVETIRQVADIPCAIGFGINTPEQAAELSKIADGVIVGSAIVKIIEEHGENAAEHIFKYVAGMKKAIHNI